jgi:hypothetical protein
MEDKQITLIIIVIVVVIVGFILTREFFCWYFKITEISNNLGNIANEISRAKISGFNNTNEFYGEKNYVNKDDMSILENSITILEENNRNLEIKNEELSYALQQLKNDFENINLKSEIKKILMKEKEYSLTRIYDEKNNSIGHEWMQVIDDGHWVTMVFDEKNGRFINVKHYRTDENYEKNNFKKDDIIKEEKLFNLEHVFGFKDKQNLYKEGKFWRYK